MRAGLKSCEARIELATTLLERGTVDDERQAARLLAETLAFATDRELALLVRRAESLAG